MEIKKLKRLLVNNQFDDLFNQLLTFSTVKKSNNWESELSILQSRYNQLQNNQIRGLINNSDFNLELNQIRNSLILVIENLSSDDKNEKDLRIQKPIKKKSKVILLVVWALIGIALFTYSLFPINELFIKSFQVKCSGSFLKLKLASEWRHNGSLHLKSIEINNAVVKTENNDNISVRNLNAKGHSELKPLLIIDSTELLLGTDNDYFVVSQIDELMGRVFVQPKSKTTVSLDGDIYEKNRYEFSTDSQDSNDNSMFLQFRDSVLFDELLIKEIEFFNLENGNLSSMINGGKMEIAGIPKESFKDLTGLFVKFSSKEGIKLKLSYKNKTLSFSGINAKSLDKLWIGNSRESIIPVKPVRLFFWWQERWQLMLLVATVWLLTPFFLSLLSHLKK